MFLWDGIEDELLSMIGSSPSAAHIDPQLGCARWDISAVKVLIYNVILYMTVQHTPWLALAAALGAESRPGRR